MANFNHIAISRTDGIGDVILTLPLAMVLKQQLPNCKISFIGKTYTQSIVEACQEVDHFVDVKSLGGDNDLLSRSIPDAIFHVFPDATVMRWAKKVGIKNRIGTMKRWSSIGFVNRPLFYSRKKSNLHEAQLNLKMLSAIGMKNDYSIEEISSMVTLVPQSITFTTVPEPSTNTVVLHPLSHGSALEWPKEQFSQLADLLVTKGFQVAVSGTEKEGEIFKDSFNWKENQIINLSGKLNLAELLAFISKSSGVIAASTGPLHMAAGSGVKALGLYSPKRPIFL